MEKTYDASLVGTKIARGMDRTVYHYGDTEVIKFSSLPYIIGKKMSAKMRYDYLLCKKYFGEYIVSTTILTNVSARSHVEIQPYLHGDYLTKKHLAHPVTHAEFQEIYQLLTTMQKDGYAPIDLIGHQGIFTLCLSNVFVDAQHHLHIFDATLFERKSLGLIGCIASPLLWFGKIRQNYVLAKFLK